MKLISHRGNINGKNIKMENNPEYILDTIKLGYDVECDIWYINNDFYLGHDEPTYLINYDFLYNEKIWFHCKNLEALYKMKESNIPKYFWHQTDDFTLTSNCFIWSFPGKKLTNKSICVLPENNNLLYDDIKNCYGICSDYINKYKNQSLINSISNS